MDKQKMGMGVVNPFGDASLYKPDTNHALKTIFSTQLFNLTRICSKVLFAVKKFRLSLKLQLHVHLFVKLFSPNPIQKVVLSALVLYGIWITDPQSTGPK
jgi:hypothetical protein